MKSQFQVRYSKAVQVFVPKAVREEIIQQAVSLAEKEGPTATTTIYFQVHEWKLRVAVQFEERLIVILTNDEADKTGFPSLPMRPAD